MWRIVNLARRFIARIRVSAGFAFPGLRPSIVQLIFCIVILTMELLALRLYETQKPAFS